LDKAIVSCILGNSVALGQTRGHVKPIRALSKAISCHSRPNGATCHGESQQADDIAREASAARRQIESPLGPINCEKSQQLRDEQAADNRIAERLPKFRPCPVPSMSGTLPSSAATVVIGIGESRADMPCEWLLRRSARYRVAPRATSGRTLIGLERRADVRFIELDSWLGDRGRRRLI
jgi:hypothetical protein